MIGRIAAVPQRGVDKVTMFNVNIKTHQNSLAVIFYKAIFRRYILFIVCIKILNCNNIILLHVCSLSFIRVTLTWTSKEKKKGVNS